MEEKNKQLRSIVHQLSNDFSGVKALVDLHAMGIKKEIDLTKVKNGLDKVNNAITELKEILKSGESRQFRYVSRLPFERRLQAAVTAQTRRLMDKILSDSI